MWQPQATRQPPADTAPEQPGAPEPIGTPAAAGTRTPAGTRAPEGEDSGFAAAADDWARQFAQLLVETLAGVRPLRQLLPWMSDRSRVRLRKVANVLHCGRRPRVLRVLTSQPAERVVEMSVIVGLGSRTRALALRLEETVRPGHPARWLCTDIETA